MNCHSCGYKLKQWTLHGKYFCAGNTFIPAEISAWSCDRPECGRCGILVLENPSNPVAGISANGRIDVRFGEEKQTESDPIVPKACPRDPLGAHDFRYVAGSKPKSDTPYIYCSRCGVKI